MGDNGAAYYNYLDAGAAVYKEDVCAAYSPTNLMGGNDENVGIPDETAGIKNDPYYIRRRPIQLLSFPNMNEEKTQRATYVPLGLTKYL